MLLVVDIILGVIIVMILAIIVMAVSHLYLGVPYVPTPKKVISTALTFAALKGTETVYDLGAGDGRLLTIAKKMYPHCTAIGYELSPIVYLWGRLKIWLSGQDVTFEMKDILTQDVSDADCIFLYLMPGVMKDLQAKFDRELTPGTKVISHAFRFPDKEPVDKTPVTWLSGKRNLWMYKW